MTQPSQSARGIIPEDIWLSIDAYMHKGIEQRISDAIAQAEARGREAGLREAATAIRECSAALNDGGFASQLVTNFCVSMATGLEALINKDRSDG